MCVVELNVSLLPCRHRWYNLLRPCSPTTNLSNCPNRLRIEGWETKCDFCPHCAGWNLSDAEFRLVSHDRSSSAGGLSRSPSSNYGSSARRATHSLSRTPSLAYSSTSTVSDGSLSSFEGPQGKNRATIPALGLSVVEESEKERPNSATRLDAYIRKNNMYPKINCETPDGDTETPVEQQAELSSETNRGDTQSQPPRHTDRSSTEDVTRGSSKFKFRPRALRGRSIKSFLSSTTKGIWRKSLRGGRARSTEETKLTDVAHDDVGCVRKEVPVDTNNPRSFERITNVNESLHQDLLGETELNSHTHVPTIILNSPVEDKENGVEDEGNPQVDTGENDKEREDIDMGADRDDRQMEVEQKEKDTENDIKDAIPAKLVVHTQEDAANEVPPRIEDASNSRPECTQSALSRDEFPDYSKLVSQSPLASDTCIPAPSCAAPNPLSSFTQTPPLPNKSIQVSYPAVTSFFAGIGLIERHIQPGRQRLRWKCRCGKEIYDDYTELRPGAIERLKGRLPCLTDSSGIPPVGASTASKTWRTLSSAIGRVSKVFGRSREKTHTSPCIPMHNSPSVGNSSSASTVSLKQNLTHLLLCMKEGRFGTNLYQEEICGLDSDRGLFEFLQTCYKTRRGKLSSFTSLRAPNGIKFVMFNLVTGRTVSLRGCSSQGCTCLPPPGRVEPEADADYRCSPVPADLCPPIGPDTLMHLFTHPECFGDSAETSILEQFPKKLKGELTGPVIGWGIYFTESWNWNLVKAILLLYMTGSFVFGLAWWMGKDDIQGAFGVAGYLINVATVFLAYIAVGNL